MTVDNSIAIVTTIATLAKVSIPLYYTLGVYSRTGSMWRAYATFLAILVAISLLEMAAVYSILRRSYN